MDKVKQNLLKILKKGAIDLDWNQAFGGKSKGNRHLLRVNKIAKYLQKQEGGDLFIILAGAWVHDVSLAFGNDNDPKHISKHTTRFLTTIKGLSPDDINKITVCATSHELGKKKISIEAQIVHDADVIDKSGLLGIIRHVWKMTNMLENRILATKSDLDNLERHLKAREAKIFTSTGKKLTTSLNLQRNLFFKDKDKALSLMRTISRSAKTGTISDKIAISISQIKSGALSKGLNNQLACSYLI